LRALHLVDVRDAKIVQIDHFVLPELGPLFELPESRER
jgi:hypothetical protein